MTSFETRFDAALCLAAQAHRGQVRKGTANAAGLSLPYV
ncbi:MAG: phosphohydrolase, partial [Sphingobacteriia bacterium]|nr:phosphohydrolase [Sphingobacteriia bacterium]